MAPSRQVRVLVVDDSAVMRSLLRAVIGCDQRLEVVGTASDGAAALRAMDSLRPDLVLLDVEMPGMDGLDTLKEMRSRGSKLPVIMCSSLTHRGAKVTIEALANGAADYVTKPAGQPSRDAAIQTLARQLIPKILVLTDIATYGASPAAAAFPGPLPNGTSMAPTGLSNPSNHLQKQSPLARPILFPPDSKNALFGVPPPSSPSQIPNSFIPAALLIGVSTGGPAALDILLPALPATFPLPILIVQHMPELFTRLLAERLDSRCSLQVAEAAQGEPVRPGRVYIARGDWHMEVAANKERASAGGKQSTLRLTQEAPEHFCRPAVDVLFRSSLAAYRSQTLAVILTGMGSDGLQGCRLIREQNGVVLAQDRETSVVWGMPGAVAQAGLAHRVLPIGSIVPEILRLSSRVQREAPLRESMV